MLKPVAMTLAHGTSTPPLARLYALLHAERADLAAVAVYAAGVGLLSLAVPVAAATLVNSIAFGTVLQPVVVLTFLVLVGLTFEGLMRVMQFWVVEVLQRRVFVNVALDVARRLPRVRASAFDHASGPELVNRFFDVVTVQKSAATLLLDGLSVILQATVGTVLLAFYHPALLAFDVVLVLGMLFVFFPLGRGAIDTSIQESKVRHRRVDRGARAHPAGLSLRGVRGFCGAPRGRAGAGVPRRAPRSSRSGPTPCARPPTGWRRSTTPARRASRRGPRWPRRAPRWPASTCASRASRRSG